MTKESRFIETLVEPYIEIEQSEELQGEEIILNEIFEDDQVPEQQAEPEATDPMQLFDDLLAAKGFDEKYFTQLDEQTEQLNIEREEYAAELDRLENEEDVEVVMEETEDI
ncbi:MAG: hypothetical protein SNG10_00935 [Rikenellaceae bacterium]